MRRAGSSSKPPARYCTFRKGVPGGCRGIGDRGRWPAGCSLASRLAVFRRWRTGRSVRPQVLRVSLGRRHRAFCSMCCLRDRWFLAYGTSRGTVFECMACRGSEAVRGRAVAGNSSTARTSWQEVQTFWPGPTIPMSAGQAKRCFLKWSLTVWWPHLLHSITFPLGAGSGGFGRFFGLSAHFFLCGHISLAECCSPQWGQARYTRPLSLGLVCRGCSMCQVYASPIKMSTI